VYGVRALKGALLRREVYADDAGPSASAGQIQRARTPYTVTEQNFTVRCLQPRGSNQHAVFFTHEREAINYHYERNPADPRVEHRLTLEVDDYGNVLKRADAAYGRRPTIRVDAQGRVRPVPNPGLAALATADQATQRTTLLTYTENRVTNTVESAGTQRNPLPCETVVYDLTGYPATAPGDRFHAEDLVEPDPNAAGHLRQMFTNQVAYEVAGSGHRCRRPVEWRRTIYRRDDLTGLLPLGELQSLALPGEQYRLAFSSGLLAQVFQRPRPGQPTEALLPDPAAVLGGHAGDQGGYLAGQLPKADGIFPASDDDDAWWMPSGRSFYTDNPADSAPTELTRARAHFFLPLRYRDAFGHDTRVRFDVHDLLIVETSDPLDNRVTAAENDYRVLLPRVVSDPNRNRTAVAFDAVGMVAGSAVMGKPAPAPAEGDTLAGFVADLTQAQADALIDAEDPRVAALPLLQSASTRIVYDLHRFRRSRQAHPDDPAQWQPACAVVLDRETHASATPPPHGLKIQVRFTYSDGFGREIQHKRQAARGRWVGNGWTIFNNKGKPVRQYEPFFSATHRFEFGVQVGVAPVLFYDPAERAVATLYPNHTYSKVVFGSWQETTYDVNDTCAERNAQTGDPRTDPDIGGYVAGYFAGQAGWETWHANRIRGALGPLEQLAAVRAAAHADTPSIVHCDALGRSFLTVARNRVTCAGHDLDGTEEESVTRILLDIEGNQRAVRDGIQQAGDPLGRIVMQYDYDMLGNKVRQFSMEAGARWVLTDAGGRPIRAWDSRGHNLTTSYDALRRPLEHTVRGTVASGDAASDPRTLDRDVTVDRIEYGEPAANATQLELDRAQRLNLRTRVFRHSDRAGIATNARLDSDGQPVEAYDFKGNLLHSTRRLVSDYTTLPDWRRDPQLEAEQFETTTRYDALNRAIQSIAPYSSLARAGRSVIQATFNETSLLERVDVWLERTAEPAALINPDGEAPSPAGVASIDYDAKGQRLRIGYKNGTSTAYGYDPLTFRLISLVTQRDAVAFPGDSPELPPANWPGRQIQNLTYTYDPIGNVIHLRDDAQQLIFFRNRRVEPSNDYTYDARYRLIQATGREHLGQQGDGVPRPPVPSNAFSASYAVPDHPSDGSAMGTYIERYVYDGVGNVLQMRHRGSDPAHPGWTRAYDYLETSLIEAGADASPKTSNRLSRTRVHPNGAPPTAEESYQHDAHGNVTSMPHLGGGTPGPNMSWDYDDQLCRVELGGGTAYYAYDAARQRVRKAWEKAPGLTEERIYLGGFEVFRRHESQAGATPTLERETLHVMDDRMRIAMVETRSLGDDPAPRQMIRYQLANDLGSASVELDELSQIISYEEYSSYGSTTYQATRNQAETPKRYRFTGMERDEESGLYLQGVRYYACWLGVWTSTDPGGLADGPNLYRYAGNNPVLKVDTTGGYPLVAPVALPALTLEEWAGSEVAMGEVGEVGMGGGLGEVEAMAPLAAEEAAVVIAGERYLRRSASLVRYGNPYGMPNEDLFHPELREIRAQREVAWRRSQINHPFEVPQVDIDPQPHLESSKPKAGARQKEQQKEQWLGRVYVTYTKFNVKTGLFYSGRTSAVIDLNGDIRTQAEEAVENRDLNHHADERYEPHDPGFLDAQIDKISVGLAVDYNERYRDFGYLAIRGREQQLVDYFGLMELNKTSGTMSSVPAACGFTGGAWTDTNPGPHLTENDVRPVAKDNPFGLEFHEAANSLFGPSPVYTGYKRGDLIQR
jgi:RHS repeat-associated protein